MKRKLITSALPYVNNIPHLGNLLQVLSADVFARFCRSRGYETVYICGTDEYGTATETRALEEKKSPRELCDFYHAIHKDIYEWFHIAFDNFGRTSTVQQTEIVQQMFLDLDKNGFIKEKTIEQLYCPECKRFLADRYVRGICPACGYENARGDQCEHCGKLLDPTELQEPRCSTCGGKPHLKSTKHLYLDLPAVQTQYTPWMSAASKQGKWAKNALQMTQAWIRDGLQERAITRDLQWGIPVPKKGFEDKVFYVWFDAPIGYISITKELDDKLAAQAEKTGQKNTPRFNWKSWWLPEEAGDTENNEPVELFQFIGKDNIPFHTVIFPSSLIGSGRNWTKLHHMSSTEYLNYESGKFSKSSGTGVFGNDAKESGIPADAWRFYIFYNRPEKSDTQFTWKDFQEKMNAELIGNLGNLVNRVTTFVARYYDGKIPQGNSDEEFWAQITAGEKRVTELLENAELKDAFHEIFAISSAANKAFQSGEPWKTRTTEPQKTAGLIYDLCYVIKDLMIMIQPYLPQYAEKVLSFFGKSADPGKITVPAQENVLKWDNLGCREGLLTIENPCIVFTPLDDARTEAYRVRYSGCQKDRTPDAESKTGSVQKKHTAEKNQKTAAKKELTSDEQIAVFSEKIALKTAKIIRVEKHPDAEKLYIETLDDGSGSERIIVSGLVPYYTEQELLGKMIVLADNLKPRKMRGVESRGMLLAADYTDADGNAHVEVLECPWAQPGTPIMLAGSDAVPINAETNFSEKAQHAVDADTFFSVPIIISDSVVTVAGKPLSVGENIIRMKHVQNGSVH